MTNPTNNGADPSNSPAREVGAQGRDCDHREVCQTGVGSEHGTDPAALSAQSRNQPDGSAISPTKQLCSICGSPDHTHLHCYGTDAQRPVSSNLRNCPFCGARPETHSYVAGNKTFAWVRCSPCNIQRIFNTEGTEEGLRAMVSGAVTRWWNGSADETSTDDPSPGSSKTEVFNAGVTQAKYRRYYYEALLRVLNSDRMLSHDIARAAICGSPEETESHVCVRDQLNPGLCKSCGKLMIDRRLDRSLKALMSDNDSSQKASAPHERVWHIQGAPDCEKCGGAGWLRGRELDNPSEDTYADTMTKYTCDGEKCLALNGKGEPK